MEDDGYKSLKSESKVGIGVQWVLTVLGAGVVNVLTNLDTSTWSGWWSTVAVAGISAIVALITAYLKRNPAP